MKKFFRFGIYYFFFFFFFFQAEDGIRDGRVTGVQTCAHPISLERSPALEAEVCYEYGVFKHHLGQRDEARAYLERARELYEAVGGAATLERVRVELEQLTRSEERRVGKECRCRWSAEH